MIILRQPVYGDSAFIHHIRNNELTRAMMFDSEMISWKKHQKWLRKVFVDADRHLFIATLDSVLVGTVRYDVEGDEARVSIIVSPRHRGCGVGAEMLRLGTVEMQKAGVKTIKAVIKTENAASQKAFAQAGYAEIGRTETEATMVCQLNP